MDSRLCSKCGSNKPLLEFTKATPKANWATTGNYRLPQTQQYHSYCKACNAKAARAFRANHATTTGVGYSGSNKIKKVLPEDRKLMSLIRHRFTCARTRIKQYGQVESDLDDDHLYQLMLAQDRKCALTGIPFIIEKKHPLCPSLDKIEPDKGYTKGNVQWLSWAVNRAKGDLDTFDFVTMCKRIVEVSERATTIP